MSKINHFEIFARMIQDLDTAGFEYDLETTSVVNGWEVTIKFDMATLYVTYYTRGELRVKYEKKYFSEVEYLAYTDKAHNKYGYIVECYYWDVKSKDDLDGVFDWLNNAVAPKLTC